MKPWLQRTRVVKTLFCVLPFVTAISDVLAMPRVARLTDLNGVVSFSPAGEEEWVYATRNRPLITGDKLWDDKDGRSVLQMSGGTICVGENTSLTVLNLDDEIAQFQLTQGTVILHVQRIKKNQQYEIDTPNLALTIQEPGDYRINVDPDGETTAVSVREGQAAVYGTSSSYLLQEGQAFSFNGTDLDSQELALAEADDLDSWCAEHFPRAQATRTKEYVSEDVIGYEDLDRYGRWQSTEEYGDVWAPSSLPVDWAPYRDGDWVWVEPWGWTWVGDEPWGFAPYHYGRWVYMSEGWYWVPGSVSAEALYVPALVAFVADLLGGDAIGWFPLGPGDVYYPAYETSREYFINVNIYNTTINKTLVQQAYNNPTAIANYRNLNAPHALTAVPKTAFVQSQPVNKALVAVPKQQLHPTAISPIAPLAPVPTSVAGTSQKAAGVPPSKALTRKSLAKSKAPAPAVPFVEKQAQLKQQPGKPLPANTLASMQAKKAPSTAVQLVTPKHAGKPKPLTPAVSQPKGKAPQPPKGQAVQPTLQAPKAPGTASHPPENTPPAKGKAPKSPKNNAVENAPTPGHSPVKPQGQQPIQTSPAANEQPKAASPKGSNKAKPRAHVPEESTPAETGHAAPPPKSKQQQVHPDDMLKSNTFEAQPRQSRPEVTPREMRPQSTPREARPQTSPYQTVPKASQQPPANYQQPAPKTQAPKMQPQQQYAEPPQHAQPAMPAQPQQRAMPAQPPKQVLPPNPKQQPKDKQHPTSTINTEKEEPITGM